MDNGLGNAAKELTDKGIRAYQQERALFSSSAELFTFYFKEERSEQIITAIEQIRYGMPRQGHKGLCGSDRENEILTLPALRQILTGWWTPIFQRYGDPPGKCLVGVKDGKDLRPYIETNPYKEKLNMGRRAGRKDRRSAAGSF